MRVSCLSFRPLVHGGNNEQRSKDRVTFTGVAEQLKYELRGDSPFLHRRVIFSCHEQLASSALVGFQTGLARVQAVPDDEFPLAVVSKLFGAGIGDVDWTDEFVVKLDKKMCVVHSDVSLPINATGSGRVQMVRRWVPIKQELVYGDEQSVAGGSLSASTTSPLGNVYCLDIFSNRASEDVEDESVVVSSETKIYWGE